MPSQAIKGLKDNKNELKDNLKKIDLKNFDGDPFNSESEDNAKDMVARIEALIIDIERVVETPTSLLQSFGHRKLMQVNIELGLLNRSIIAQDFWDAGEWLEKLKPFLQKLQLQPNVGNAIDRLAQTQSSIHKPKDNLAMVARAAQTQSSIHKPKDNLAMVTRAAQTQSSIHNTSDIHSSAEKKHAEIVKLETEFERFK